MDMKRIRLTFRIPAPKRRRFWKINPATRIEEGKKSYRRSQEKERLRRTLKKEGGKEL